ncbi:MAG TPA: hypothetical protein VD886_02000, partial [Herpetosiphonaceae bacterium]|nr:hypothetical protein [Herpetosiphonaceae bacterium]
MAATIEHSRLAGDQHERWARWGAYLGCRAWGTARESGPDGEDAWRAFPWEHAGNRAYRWGEDGIGGFCDNRQRICLALAFWNERDPLLKERFFGLANHAGNHGEDVKDYFFYLDALPSGAYLRMRYLYPQAEFPYARLRHENALRGQAGPEFELIDALPRTFGEGRYFDILIEYAKADSEDILCRVTATNRGPDAAPLHILPLIWLPDTADGPGAPGELAAEAGDAAWASVLATHAELGTRRWSVEGPGGLLFTDNASDLALLYDQPNPGGTINAIDRAVVRGRPDALNPAPRGGKCAAHRQATLRPGESWSVRIRFRPADGGEPPAPAGGAAEFDRLIAERAAEADAFYAAVQRPEHDAEARAIQRAAFAGLNWNKIVYRFNVERWLRGATGSHRDAPEEREKHSAWRHLDACDVISVPDPWEFPFLATWDLDFQLITLGLIDPVFAKQQALLLLSERYQRADGAMPGAEGDFSLAHPPLHAWAVWHLAQLSGDRDLLAAAYPGLKRHFAWWRRTLRQPDGAYGGGFLGMDNISLFDRNAVPEGHRLAQADGTGWMAHFALIMLAQAIELGHDDDAVEFLAEFGAARRALAGLWDAESGFFYDALIDAEGRRTPLKVRSVVGLVPLLATLLIDPAGLAGLPRLCARLEALRGAETG